VQRLRRLCAFGGVGDSTHRALGNRHKVSLNLLELVLRDRSRDLNRFEVGKHDRDGTYARVAGDRAGSGCRAGGTGTWRLL